MNEPSFFEKLILEEISGKNQAIHAYDRIMWTVRTGFLTLFFAGWGILLKALAEKSSKDLGALDNNILLMMLFISVALGIGAIIVDRNYSKRKFRVIYALDNLTSTIVQKRGQISDGLGDSEVYLLVAGDKDDTKYRDVTGYRHEANAIWMIYLIPMIAAVVGVCVLWK